MELRELQSICQSITDCHHSTPLFTTSGKVVLRNFNIKDGHLILDDIYFTDEKNYKIRTSRAIPAKGDIVITREAPMGEVCIVPEGLNCCLGQRMVLLKPNQGIVDSNFLLYSLMSRYVQTQIFKSEGTGSIVSNLRIPLLKALKIPYVNLPNQILIGSTLKDLDDKIELNNRIINEIEQIAKLLYNYWFLQFDFQDSTGFPYKSSGGLMIYNNKLKKEIPHGWEVKEIGDLVNSINTGLNPRKHFKLGEGDNYYITIKNIEYGRLVIDSTCDRIDDDALARIQLRSNLSKGDILFTSIEPVGKTYLILDSPEKWNINESVFSFKPNLDLVTSEYLFMLLSSDEVKVKGKNSSTGSIHKGIRLTPLKKFVFPYPPKSMINSFTQIIRPMLEKINLAQMQNQHLTSLRDWLLPMLMNGQVKVKGHKIGFDGDTDHLGAFENSHRAATELVFKDTEKGFVKQVLAGYIVSNFKDDPNFTEIKFQKIQFLAEHVIGADLNLNYYYQAAGPYDNKFMHTIYNDFRKQKWFDYESKRFKPLEKHDKIKDYYWRYFSPVEEQLTSLFDLLYSKSEAEAEIVATLYAVWNNRLIGRQEVCDRIIIDGFYQWSDRKHRYSLEQVNDGLRFLKDYQLEPKGFGKLIKMAKLKNQ